MHTHVIYIKYILRILENSVHVVIKRVYLPFLLVCLWLFLVVLVVLLFLFPFLLFDALSPSVVPPPFATKHPEERNKSNYNKIKTCYTDYSMGQVRMACVDRCTLYRGASM